MHVTVAGSSGFLGQRLVERLRADGDVVTRLVRHAPRADDERRWDPYAGRLAPDVLTDVDAVVNLAGSPTAGNPHSKKWARELEESRVTTTRVLAEAIAATEHLPAFLAGNGISFAGDHGGAPVTEDTDSRGDALLTRVTRRWQEATAPAVAAGSRVVVLRTAPVLDRRSAPLKQMLMPWRLGLGARLGTGTQYFPCISLRDWVGAVVFALRHDQLSGPVNLCCPQTPTNAEFTVALADAVGRKALLAVPAAVLRPAAGAMAPELLGSVNARPQALHDAGFRFRDRDVRDVLTSALAR